MQGIRNEVQFVMVTLGVVKRVSLPYVALAMIFFYQIFSYFYVNLETRILLCYVLELHNNDFCNIAAGLDPHTLESCSGMIYIRQIYQVLSSKLQCAPPSLLKLVRKES